MNDSLKEWITVCSQSARRNQVIQECTNDALTTIEVMELVDLNKRLIDEACLSLKDYSELKPLYLGTLAIANKWQTEKQMVHQTQVIDYLEEKVIQLKKLCQYTHVLDYKQFYHLLKDTLKADALHHVGLLKQFHSGWLELSNCYRYNLWLLEEHCVDY